MTNLLDNICALRNLIASKQYEKFKFHKMQILQLKEEIHRQVKKKLSNYSHELEFTSQDLRELAQDIHDMFHDWEEFMKPAKHIKAIYTDMQDNKIDIRPFQNEVIPLMMARTESIQAFAELLSLIEYHATFLYFLELASNDKFAINFTERLI